MGMGTTSSAPFFSLFSSRLSPYPVDTWMFLIHHYLLGTHPAPRFSPTSSLVFLSILHAYALPSTMYTHTTRFSSVFSQPILFCKGDNAASCWAREALKPVVVVYMLCKWCDFMPFEWAACERAFAIFRFYFLNVSFEMIDSIIIMELFIAAFERARFTGSPRVCSDQYPAEWNGHRSPTFRGYKPVSLSWRISSASNLMDWSSSSMNRNDRNRYVHRRPRHRMAQETRRHHSRLVSLSPFLLAGGQQPRCLHMLINFLCQREWLTLVRSFLPFCRNICQ